MKTLHDSINLGGPSIQNTKIQWEAKVLCLTDVMIVLEDTNNPDNASLTQAAAAIIGYLFENQYLRPNVFYKNDTQPFEQIMHDGKYFTEYRACTPIQRQFLQSL